MELAQVILFVVGAYGAVGVIFAVAFVTFGVERVDHSAKGAGFVFRALIVPGTAVLWPAMLVKWARSARGGNP